MVTFDPAFRLYRDDPQARAIETLGDIFVEVDAELARRRQLYPDLVRKGRLTTLDMQRELRVWSAIFDSLAFGDDRRRRTGAVATWTERVHALRREIGLRRTLYPRWITAGRMTQVDGDRQLLLIESLHDLTWTHSQEQDAIAARMEAAARLAA